MKNVLSLLPVGLPLDDLFFLAIAFVALIVFLAIGKSSMRHNQAAQRVKALQERRAQLNAQLIAPRKRSKTASPIISVNLMRDIVNKMNLLQKSQVGKINRLLNNAGYRSKDAIVVFTFLQLIFPIVAFALSLAITKLDLAAPFATKWKPIVVMGMTYFGFKLPGIMVINKGKKRYYEIQKGLSDTLDLMMICAEAGLSLAAGLDRVARELGETYPEMADELSLTSIELGFLPDRKRALMNLTERVDIPEIRGIVGVLIQTEKYGTPVAQALWVLASEFREQRMLRAEQKAAKLPSIMTLPLIIFILPTLFIVVITPAMLNIFAAQAAHQ